MTTTKLERHPIQIAYAETKIAGEIDTTLIVLCNDGSMWWRGLSMASYWNFIPPIPQGEI